MLVQLFIVRGVARSAAGLTCSFGSSFFGAAAKLNMTAEAGPEVQGGVV